MLYATRLPTYAPSVGFVSNTLGVGNDSDSCKQNIQHPGEGVQPHPARNDPANPKGVSAWPDGTSGGRPRSATIVIRRKDGGLIGA